MATLFDKVSGDIRAAMKARDKVRTEALRNIKKYFIEAKTAPGANDTLDDDTALKILQNLPSKAKKVPTRTPKLAETISRMRSWHR